jgi:hypothetical protein
VLRQVLVGSLLISASIAVEAVFIGLAVVTLRRLGGRLVSGRRVLRQILTLIVMTLWLLVALGVGVWLWAVAFMILGLFETLEAALYFSAVAFTTLGFGDVTLDAEWRLLSGFIAANGLVLFSLTTAFLIELMRRLGDPRPNGR